MQSQWKLTKKSLGTPWVWDRSSIVSIHHAGQSQKLGNHVVFSSLLGEHSLYVIQIIRPTPGLSLQHMVRIYGNHRVGF
jgi:hypothetical protein